MNAELLQVSGCRLQGTGFRLPGANLHLKEPYHISILSNYHIGFHFHICTFAH
jgi:hypothetical protein